ncbi:MAG: hypothetical protein JSV45_10475 [Chromatiales bacterium]|nr:MAG: hypothetical protein JSV45_10475 [Chromatiales bacterium]
MERLTKIRQLRLASLPYAVLLLAVIAGYGFVSVGQAEEAMEELVVTAPRLTATDAEVVRAQIEDTAADAAWRTRITVASQLSARLNVQHRPYRLASRGGSWSKTG